MLKEFIQHIQETTKPYIENLDEGSRLIVRPNAKAEEFRPTIDHPDTLPLNSLDALVKMVVTEALPATKANVAPLYITIPSPLQVQCFTHPNYYARFYRQFFYEVNAVDVPGFNDGYREQTKAIIELRSKFVPNEGTEYLLDLLSRISKDSNVTSKDNGVSQTVEARQGVSLMTTVAVKPRIPLRPYRTFQEVEQPESEFLLRLDNEGNVGLFEADGGMWRLEARQTIKKFLENALEAEVAAGEVYIAL